MGVRVKDPQQNLHKWTGTLVCDSRKVIGKTLFRSGEEFIFIKTSRDAHFVSQGTYIGKLGMLSREGDAIEAVRAINASRKIPRAILKEIVKELNGYLDKLPIVEIQEVDNSSTPPLPKIINAVTRGLFLDDDWLDQNGKYVGDRNIRIGRELQPLPF